MRRWWVIALALGLFALPALACGSTPTPTSKPSGANVAPTVTTTPTHSAVATQGAQPTNTSVPLKPTATTKPTDVPKATNTPMPPAATAPPAFKSGGLGKTRAEWEAVYQKPEKEQSGLITYANGNYYIMFLDGRVSYIEHRWGDQDAKSLDYATGAAKPLLPTDAKLLQTYKSRAGSTVDLFHSDALAQIFPAEAFIAGAPGDFVVIYGDITGKVTRFVIGLGNNP